MTDKVGPLPRRAASHSAETASRVALEAALPPDEWVVRRESDDVGVDVTLEVVVDGFHTNVRAQVQLKATEETDFNADGSVSISVTTANLRYLQNTRGSLYVCHVAAAKELRFLWAADVAAALDRDNPGWEQQQTVTLRFLAELTPTSLTTIRERLLAEARLQRSVAERVARHSTTERLLLTIDTSDLTVMGPDDLAATLEAQGETLVAAGRAREVLDVAGSLPASAARTARIQMILAHAEYALGRFDLCSGRLRELARSEGATPAGLELLRDACDLLLHRITPAEFEAREERRELAAEGVDALLHRLNKLRIRMQQQHGIVDAAGDLVDLKATVAEVLSSPTATDTMKLEAEILLLYAAGTAHVRFSTANAYYESMRSTVRLPWLNPNASGIDSTAGWSSWRSGADDVLRRARELGQPVVLADVLATTCAVRIHRYIFETLTSGHPPADGGACLEEAITEGREAMMRYEAADVLEGHVRSTIMVAEAHLLRDEPAVSAPLAARAVGDAKVMGYDKLQLWAHEISQGVTLLARFEAEHGEAAEVDIDVQIGSEDDASIARMAQDTCAALGLPKDRLPILRRVWESERAISQARTSWCRHITLIENLAHTQSRSTMYAQDPNRRCRCLHKGVQSAIACTDTLALIDAFKSSHCIGCDARSPKTRAGQDAATS